MTPIRSRFTRHGAHLCLIAAIGFSLHAACDGVTGPDSLDPLLSLAAEDVSAATIENQPVTITLETDGALLDGQQLVPLTQPQSGTLDRVEATDASSVTITYSPAQGFVGQDTFEVALQHEGVTIDQATVTIAVYPEVRFSVEIVSDTPDELVVHAQAFSGSGHPLPEGEYQWAFDSTVESGPLASHATRSFAFAPSGTHTVTLTVMLSALGSVQCSSGPTGDAKQAQVQSAATQPGTGALAVSPTEPFTTTGHEGGDFVPASKSYALKNAGSASIQWQATGTKPWLTLSAHEGSLDPGETTIVDVTLNETANDMNVGTHADTVSFINVTNGVGNIVRIVQLDVVPMVPVGPGVLAVAPSFGFSTAGLQGGPFLPQAQSYLLTNIGGTTLNWTASKTTNWLSLSSNAGSLNPGDATTVTVSANASANTLNPGNHSDTISFTNTTNGLGNTTRSVSLTAAAPGGLLVTPGNHLIATGLAGGPFTPDSQAYTLTNTGSSPVTWTASKTKTWVSLSSSGGTLNAGESASLTVSLNSNANSLGVGTHGDLVTITNNSNGVGSTTRSVSLTIVTPGALSISPATGLTSSGNVGGPFAPGSAVYNLTNTGGTTISWTASKTQSWVTLSSTFGTLSPGASTAVTASINTGANGLPAGTHNDLVAFVNVTNGSGNTTRPVALTVTSPGNLAVTPVSGLNCAGPAGGPFTPTSKSYNLVNNGGSPINWTASKSKGWVSLSSSGGTLNPGANTTLTVSLGTLANTLPAGTHSDTVSIVNTTNGNGTTSRAVNLSVTAENDDCMSSNSTWQNETFAAQTGIFTAEFDAVPTANGIDAVTGLSANPAGSYSDLAAIVRFNASGTIDARNGGTYSAAASVSYSAGTMYHFRLLVDVPARKYDVYVTPQGASEVTLAQGYAFRSEQAGANSLSNWSLISDNDTHDVCDFAIQGQQTGLSVSPSGGLTASGEPGGPFAPSSQQFTVTNSGDQPISFSVSKGKSWVSLSSSGGTLNPGASATVVVSINAGANSLAQGLHSDTVSFVNATNGIGNTSRSVVLSIATGGGQMASSISQYGITWTFDHAYQVGQYATGDWWVVGPATITSISPSPSGGRNGTMINPRVLNQQGYDSRSALQYNAALCANPPFTAQPGDSVVSTISYSAVTNKTFIKSAAVLTCVDVAQPGNCFRPPYTRPTRVAQSAADTLRFSVDQLQWDLLPQLVPPTTPPSLSATTAQFSRPWVTHYQAWSGYETMPNENMPNYGREWANATSEASMQLVLNYSAEQKLPLLVGFVQLGIDLYGNRLDGAKWGADAGIFQGRKWPILFAGIMLNHSGMKSPGYSTGSGSSLRHIFAEDGHTYYLNDPLLPAYATITGQAVSAGTSGAIACQGVAGAVGRANGGPGSAVMWRIREGENFGVNEMHEHLDVAQWSNDTELQRKSESYRRCCSSASYVGNALAARLMGAVDLWGHDAFFDYVDRWMTEDDTAFLQQTEARWPGNGYNNFPQGSTSSNFVTQMWSTYR